MKLSSKILIFCLFLTGSTLLGFKLLIPFEDPKNSDWAEYLGGSDRNHYSELTQINKGNLSKLKIAWSYATQDSGQIQVNPLIINGILYGVSPSVQAFALNAATGEEIWKFGDPLKAWHSTSRGVAYWSNGNDKRILYTVGPNLWCLNALNGKPIEGFGDKGKIDLHQGLPEIANNKFIISNTPGTVVGNLIIMPLRLSEGEDAAPGDIRAFDVLTGKIAWTFHTIPYPGEFGYETFPKDAYKNEYTGAANNWAGMAVDKKRNILFVPTGSAGYDFYGGNRKGTNLFANCLLALDAKTGKRLWHFQTTHHDIWDKDLPAPPNLMTITKNGRKIDVVCQVTKQGFVFVFDRQSGKTIYPIDEVKVPVSNLEGEKNWPTQPRPRIPAAFARQSNTLTSKDISPFAENKDELIQSLNSYKKAFYAPPSKVGTVIFPGFDGGAEWGGAAADPEGVLYVNSNEMAWIQTMKSTKIPNNLSKGEKVYQSNCANCHKSNRIGNTASGYPKLLGIKAKYDRTGLLNFINNGKGMMPGFNFIKNEDKQALIAFLLDEEKKEVENNTGTVSKASIPYKMNGYNKFLDSKGLPAISPPWGTLNAIDINTGKYLWKIPFGEEETLADKTTGTENYGGPIVTASGLLLIAATKDGKFRIFDKSNGKLLWETKLPAAGFATPSTYMVNGKQYVVIACGGTKLGTKKGNQYVAFALEN